jgi:5-methyltetrahydrofolate--homocysteine methyltransferase
VFKDYPLSEIRPYIDWTPFFSTWMLKGKYPAIFNNEVVGAEARKLYDDANKMLDQLIADGSLHAHGIVGLYPANAVSHDDVKVVDEAGKELTTFHFLRQQGKKSSSVPNLSLADFVAPSESGKQDYIGGFAVTAGDGLDPIVKKFEAEHDDYSSIMAKAIADRLAEAFAELLHQKVRMELWGYAKDEKLGYEELIKETYAGIRPAPGYPACPDHTEKRLLFDLLQVEQHTGIYLTESFAMHPAASVSGFYFAHPSSRYFGLGKIEKDQVEQYARRKGFSLEEMEKWLSPNLNYEE